MSSAHLKRNLETIRGLLKQNISKKRKEFITSVKNMQQKWD